MPTEYYYVISKTIYVLKSHLQKQNSTCYNAFHDLGKNHCIILDFLPKIDRRYKN